MPNGMGDFKKWKLVDFPRTVIYSRPYCFQKDSIYQYITQSIDP